MPFYRFCRGDAVIAGDNQSNSVCNRLVDHAAIESVAVRDAVWQRIGYIRADSAESFHKDIRGADSVDIVIADHADFCFRADGTAEKLRGALRIKKEPWIIQIVQSSIQIFPHRIGSGYPAVPEDPG